LSLPSITKNSSVSYKNNRIDYLLIKDMYNEKFSICKKLECK